MNISDARPIATKNAETKTLPVFQNKGTKSDSRHSYLGKQLTRWRKHEQKKSTQEKPKREKGTDRRTREKS